MAIKCQGVAAPTEEIVPSKEPVVKPVTWLNKRSTEKAPGGVGEPTCTSCDHRGFYNGENASSDRPRTALVEQRVTADAS